MENITNQSKKQIFLNNVKTVNNLSVEEVLLQDAQIASAMQDVVDNDFLQPSEIYLSDFVETKQFNTIFDKSILDIQSTNLAINASNILLDNNKNTLDSQFSNLQLKTNILNSMVDASAISNNMSLGNIGTITETFSTTNDILTQHSTLLVDVFEKRVTLPIKSTTVIDLNKANITILDSSNGYINNGNVHSMCDGSTETFLDYRQTTSVDQLELNVNIVLNDIQIFNQLNINVNNFSTQNWTKLTDILYSIDGNQYYSVFENKQFYQSYLFNSITNKVIVLNPINNNMLDNFTIDFAPIKAKYIQLSLLQDKIHPVDLEYEIGIKEFGLAKVTYEDTGSVIIKKSFDTTNVEALGIQANMLSNLNTKILNVSFAISFDMSTWYNIQPSTSTGSDPTSLYVNAPWMTNSINMTSTGYIYIKVTFDKTTTDIQTLINQIASDFTSSNYEYFTFPSSLPYSFNLKYLPVENTLNLYSVPFIGVGKYGYNQIVLGTTNEHQNTYIYKFLVNIRSTCHIFIDNLEIKQYSTKEDLLYGDYTGYAIDGENIYINVSSNVSVNPNYTDPWLTSTKQDSYTSTTSILLDNRDIALVMDADVIQSVTRKIPLTYLTDGIKDNISVSRMSLDEGGNLSVTGILDIIPSGITKIHLSNTPILDMDIEMVGSYRVTFIDGFTEFRGLDFVYSIDVANKMLYLSNAYTSADITINYFAYDILTLTSDDFLLEQSGDTDYVVVNTWLFDPKWYYRIEYNASLFIPQDIYRADQLTVTFSDAEIMKMLMGNGNFSDKHIKAIYTYNESLDMAITEFLDTLTPILGNLSILYSVVL